MFPMWRHGHRHHSKHDVEVRLSVIPWIFVSVITLVEVAVIIMAIVAAFGLDSWIALTPVVFRAMVLVLAILSIFFYTITVCAFAHPREGYSWLLIAKASLWLFMTLVTFLWYFAYGTGGGPGSPSMTRWAAVLASIWTLGSISVVLYIIPVSIQMFKLEMARRITHEIDHKLRV